MIVVEMIAATLGLIFLIAIFAPIVGMLYRRYIRFLNQIEREDDV